MMSRTLCFLVWLTCVCAGEVGLVVCYGMGFHTAVLAGFGLILALVSLIDMQTRRIPNGLVGAVLLLRVGELARDVVVGGDWSAVLLEGIASALSAVVVIVFLLVVVAIAQKIAPEATFGAGDIKLSGACTFHIGLAAGFGMLLIASVAALGWVGINSLWVTCFDKHRKTISTFAFGPFLSIACWVCVLAKSIGLMW